MHQTHDPGPHPSSGRAPEPDDAAADPRRPSSATQPPDIAGTPMFRQYLAAKSQHEDAILMFRMGDFYEMFFEDARVASKALELTLTSRGRGTSSEAPMCGVPVHAAEGYIARLVRLGHRVAICEQTEDPKTAKGLVAREVVRVVTPGTVTDASGLEARVSLYVGSVTGTAATAGLALADLSTGAFLAWEGPPAAAREILAGYAPREILHAERAQPSPSVLGDLAGTVLLSARPDGSFHESGARKILQEQFGVATLEGFGLGGKPLAVSAAGALIAFLRDTQKGPLAHIERVRWIDAASCVVIDQTTRRNLEIVRAMDGDPSRPTLVGVLDATCTAMGGRRLRDYLLRPLVERRAIEERLDAVGELLEQRAAREAFRDTLRTLPDLERLAGRVCLRKATPRDLLGVRRAIEAFPRMREGLSARSAELLKAKSAEVADLGDLTRMLARAIADEPPATARDGGVIRDGFDADVDRWRSAQRTARRTLAEMETRERARTGIGSLKVRFNSVFGYYLEVSRSHLDSVPSDYIRKQTLVGAERFITPELKAFEETLLKAESELAGREMLLFGQVVDEVAAHSAAILQSARALAEVDVLASFAEVAETNDYVRPQLMEEPFLHIVAGRHPVVERLSGSERFIANDLTLDADAQILILTGPNMGGKSTYLRQTALIVLMAQAGSYVPAQSARIGIADRIFCRVGASDNLSGGQSTFLVEMSETANILHSATSRSLVLLDEVGRGTATFDGLSIAWAVVEWLHDNPSANPRSLFATHYHELTDLALVLARVRNLHISAREYKDTVLFLRKVEQGPADKSYGIHVARLAGLPRDVTTRAREVLDTLERKEFGRDGLPSLARRQDHASEGQLPLFVPAAEIETPAPGGPLIEELRALDPDHLTPLEALGLIARWKRSLE